VEAARVSENREMNTGAKCQENYGTCTAAFDSRGSVRRVRHARDGLTAVSISRYYCAPRICLLAQVSADGWV